MPSFQTKTEKSSCLQASGSFIGGGPAGSSSAEALAAGGVETFLFERSPATAKPCGGAIPLCMLDEFSIPNHLIDRRVTQMRIVSPSNLIVDFGKTLKPYEFIAMLRQEMLDSFLRRRAEATGDTLLKALATNLVVPTSLREPYVMDNCQRQLAVDVVIGADGANNVPRAVHLPRYISAKFMELCGDEYVQMMTFDSYLYKKLASGNRGEDAKMAMNTISSLVRCNIMGREVEASAQKILSRV
ncbi:hypothetical protein RND71_007473 [Anisodus tanguticus]|uniref:FAD-binding domain-containing protein n=1 Tax=Anisodus tanguticus TaxID=243964 RepID=A0AAE1SJY3_9SOLA|nr:hypothetical protein RND71_007473 [Anisodus tanguticus]